MRKTIYDRIPTYEELKLLDKNYEYSYIIYDIAGSGYIRIYYNEDQNGKISVDYMEGGYLHGIHLPIIDRTDIVENEFYNLNKKNYNKIIKFINLVKESIIEELTKYEKENKV